MADLDALRAARDWATEHGHEQPDDRMLRAYGQALLDQLAEQLRDLAERAASDVVYIPPEYVQEVVAKRSRAATFARAANIAKQALGGGV